MSFGIVLNQSSNEFRLSERALLLYQEYSGQRYFHHRDDPSLVRVIEELGTETSSYGCQLIVVYLSTSLKPLCRIKKTRYGEEIVLDRGIRRVSKVLDDDTKTKSEKLHLLKELFKASTK